MKAVGKHVNISALQISFSSSTTEEQTSQSLARWTGMSTAQF